jgi:hypothetical protein
VYFPFPHTPQVPHPNFAYNIHIILFINFPFEHPIFFFLKVSESDGARTYIYEVLDFPTNHVFHVRSPSGAVGAEFVETGCDLDFLVDLKVI